MSSSLDSGAVTTVLDRLFQAAERGDAQVIERASVEFASAGGRTARQASALFADAFLPVSREVGRLLYALARNRRPATIVEFGTSFGISTIHLAAAVRDNGAGRVVTTELEPGKVQRAREYLREAGLLDLVDIREGDAQDTLRNVDGEVDLVLLDGWKDLYLPVLTILEPRFRPGTLVVADDLHLFPEAMAPYLDYVRNPNGRYVSVEVSLGDGLELSVFASRDDHGTP